VILSGQSGSYIVPIEVKLFSAKHGVEEQDQLARYYVALASAEGRQTFACEAIQEFSGELLALVYVIQFSAQHEIEDSLRRLESEGMGESREKLFHLRWQNVHGVMKDLLSSERDPFRRNVLLDIAELMTHRGLMPFEGFPLLPRELSTEVLRPNPVFFGSS